MTRVVAVCGSRRAGSYTRAALEYVLAAAGDAGADTAMLDLGAVDLPLYHPDEDEQGESTRLTHLVREADGVVLGTPVYHGSYSSTLKNFHDYCGKEEYESTAVGLVATAGGGSYAPTLEHMRATVRNVHGLTIPQQVGIRGASHKFVDGRLTDDDIADRLGDLGREVVVAARRLSAPDCEPAPVDD